MASAAYAQLSGSFVVGTPTIGAPTIGTSTIGASTIGTKISPYAATVGSAPMAISQSITKPVVPTMTYGAVQTAFAGADVETPWGGGCPWQSDKTAFKQFCRNAIENPAGKERKELYGFLAECFMDADGDRDGVVTMQDFDFLIEKSAALPRRFGMAPSWVEMYGDVAHRNQARKSMFMQIDTFKRGYIGLEEWVAFSIRHITEKVRAMDVKTMDFAHLAGAGAEEFVAYCEKAVSDRHSEQYKSLYEHLFKVFVESDVEEAGVVHYQNFDKLIDDAAKAPREAGLAPSAAEMFPTAAAKTARRKAEWDAIEPNGQGITFAKFLTWAVKHIAQKCNEYRAGKRYGRPAPVATMQYAAPLATRMVSSGCPITGAVGACPFTGGRVL